MKNRTEEAAITRARTPIDTRPLRERLTDLDINALSFEEANARLDAAGPGAGLPLVPPTGPAPDAIAAHNLIAQRDAEIAE